VSADPSQELVSLREEVAFLRDAVRARDEFISMIVHEVRNPLTPLLMQSSSLLLLVKKERAVPHRISRAVVSLNSIVEHLMRRTATLLDISRMSSGIYRLDPSEVDVSAIVSDVVERMSIEAGGAGSTLHATIEPGVVGWWDPLALEQIADNLVSNAIKYGNGKPVEVELTAHDGIAALTVRDQGMGISPDNLNRVFDRFERAVRRGQASGFGVGLWLVGRLTQQMGGEIDIQSALDEGTRIVIKLPTRRMTQSHDSNR